MPASTKEQLRLLAERVRERFLAVLAEKTAKAHYDAAFQVSCEYRISVTHVARCGKARKGAAFEYLERATKTACSRRFHRLTLLNPDMSETAIAERVAIGEGVDAATVLRWAAKFPLEKIPESELGNARKS